MNEWSWVISWFLLYMFHNNMIEPFFL